MVRLEQASGSGLLFTEEEYVGQVVENSTQVQTILIIQPRNIGIIMSSNYFSENLLMLTLISATASISIILATHNSTENHDNHYNKLFFYAISSVRVSKAHSLSVSNSR